MKIAIYSFSKNADMESYCKYLISDQNKSIVYTRETQLLAGIQRHDAVLIVSHGIKSFIIAAYSKIKKKPLICFIHDEIPHPSYKYPIIWLLNKILSKSAKGLVFFSKPQIYNHTNHIVTNLPCAIQPSSKLKRPKELTHQLFKYAMFGRGESYKHTEDFWSALELSKDSILVAGRGWEKQVPKNIRHKVILIDRYIEDAEIAWILVNSCGILLPYRSATQSGLAPIISAFNAKAFIKDDMLALKNQLNNYTSFHTVSTWEAFFRINEYQTISNERHHYWDPTIFSKNISEFLKSQIQLKNLNN